MKHEIMCLHTKKALAASLKKYLEKKPLSKITVKDIIEDCGVNRKTFYYHFPNIYELLKWMLAQETVEVVRKYDLTTHPEEAIAFVMDYVEENKHILNCVYDSVGQEEMKRFFYRDFIDTANTLLDQVAKELDLQVEESFKLFFASFLTEALSGCLMQYFKSQENKNRQETLNNILLICKHSISNVLLAKAEEDKMQLSSYNRSTDRAEQHKSTKL